LKSYGTGQIHVAGFLTPTKETRFGDIVLAAHRFDGLAAIALPENKDDFFSAVEFVFHEHFLLRKWEEVLLPETVQIYAVRSKKPPRVQYYRDGLCRGAVTE
jgi:hypothetical protein